MLEPLTIPVWIPLKMFKKETGVDSTNSKEFTSIIILSVTGSNTLSYTLAGTNQVIDQATN